MFDTIIEIQEFFNLKKDTHTVVVDCRYDLNDKCAGRKSYIESHIPGAVYADVHDDLSGPPVTDHGRHPLPAPDHLVGLFNRLGVCKNTQIVTYDNNGGAFASRLWWLARYMHHDAVAVLDGGWQAWKKSGLPVSGGLEEQSPGDFSGQAHHEWLVTVEGVPDVPLLVDSRDPVRYRGDEETLDKAAGHIPGAINYFWKNNLDGEGYFRPPAELHAAFSRLLEDTLPADAVFYCGSGVTACMNLLSAAHAGFPLPRLYAGSWSDWCSDPGRPVATGNEPGRLDRE